MPAYARTLRQHARLHNEPRIIRIVECLAGSVRMRQVFDPRPDYARSTPAIERVDARHLHADGERIHLCLAATVDVDAANPVFSLETGETVAFSLRAQPAGRCTAPEWSVERARRVFRDTRQFWWQWIAQVRYEGPYQQHIWRSALALKLMTYAPSGAIIAAPTTSLPEAIGGTRNWDYRFTWLRDASFTLYAFFQLGLSDEADAFYGWLTRRHLGEGRRRGVANLFDLSGRARSTEVELTGLAGYRGSKPVRVGNAATAQLQLDVYGELLDSAYIYARFGRGISRALWRECRAIVELAIEQWQQPDSSIWEVRSQRQQYTYSKIMCWVAVDRGLRIAEHYGLPHDAVRWRAARRAIHRAITKDGWSRHRGAFTQSLGGDALDAAVLRISQTRFLPDRDPRVMSTVRAIRRHLSTGVLLRRYNVAESQDGVGGGEGAFLMTSFWYVDALAHVGDVEHAQRHFEQLLNFASPAGLFSEEVDASTGALLGNYPQAFTHLSMVGAAVNIERARRGRLGVRGLRRGGPRPGRRLA